MYTPENATMYISGLLDSILFLGKVQVRQFPSGDKEIEFEYSFKKFIDVTWTFDESSIVCLGCEKQKVRYLSHVKSFTMIIHAALITNV